MSKISNWKQTELKLRHHQKTKLVEGLDGMQKNIKALTMCTAPSSWLTPNSAYEQYLQLTDTYCLGIGTDFKKKMHSPIIPALKRPEDNYARGSMISDNL